MSFESRFSGQRMGPKGTVIDMGSGEPRFVKRCVAEIGEQEIGFSKNSLPEIRSPRVDMAQIGFLEAGPDGPAPGDFRALPVALRSV